MPSSENLPDDLKAFSNLNALEIRHTKFDSDMAVLILALETSLREFEVARVQWNSDQDSQIQPPSLETKNFLRQHLGEPKGIGAVIFAQWQG